MLEEKLWISPGVNYTHLTGPTLLQAPPGSGKTELIAASAAHYLNSGHAPESLVVLVPSRVAGDRLKKRISNYLTDPTAVPAVHTFSAYAFHLLARALQFAEQPGQTLNPVLLTGADQDLMLKILLSDAGAAQRWPEYLHQALTTAGFRKEVREFFDRMNEYGLDESALKELAASVAEAPEAWPALAELFTQYTQVKNLNNRLSFDPAELISRAAAILGRGLAVQNQIAQGGIEQSGIGQSPGHSSGTGAEHGAGVGPDWVEFASQQRRMLKLILVDDLQEATPGVHRLLSLIGQQQRLLAVACVDVTVQGFRGAAPELLNYADNGHRVLQFTQRYHWQHSHRLQGALAGLYQQITEQLGAPGTSSRARLQSIGPAAPNPAEPAPAEAPSQPHTAAIVPAAADSADPQVQLALTASDEETQQYILATVLDQLAGGHARAPIPLNQQAVIARTGGQVQRIAASLRAEGIPVRLVVSDVVLAEEPAVRGLFLFISAAEEIINWQQQGDEGPPQPLSRTRCHGLLTSSFIGLSAVQLRRINLALGHAVTSLPSYTDRLSQLLNELITAEDAAEPAAEKPAAEEAAEGNTVRARLRSLSAEQRTALLRCARMVRTVLSGLAKAEPAEETLWSLWCASECAQPWQQAALTPGPHAQNYHADLDALVTLCEVANRFGEQQGGTIRQFADYVRTLQIPTDSLAQAGANQDALAVLTPAAAAGQQFHTVIVAGLQQGQWPNDQIRGTIVGSAELVDVLNQRPHTGPAAEASRRQSTREDELRLLAATISRAAHQVIAVAEATEEAQPSTFVNFFLPAAQRYQAEPLTPLNYPLPATPAMVVGQLRRSLRAQTLVPEISAHPQMRLNHDQAVAALAYLAAQPFPELAPARPEEWWGVRGLSSQEGILTPEQPLRVSPSAVQVMSENPLRWFSQKIGSDPADDNPLARRIGVLVHRLAELHPQGWAVTENEKYAAEIQAALPQHTFATAQRSAIVPDLVNKLGYYLRERAHQGAQVVGTETRFRSTQHYATGNNEEELTIILSGIVDRIEQSQDAAGQSVVNIYDFKTSNMPISDKDLEQNKQLLFYRWVYEQQLLNLDGATQTSEHLPLGRAGLILLGHQSTDMKRWVREQQGGSTAAVAEILNEILTQYQQPVLASVTTPGQHFAGGGGLFEVGQLTENQDEVSNEK